MALRKGIRLIRPRFRIISNVPANASISCIQFIDKEYITFRDRTDIEERDGKY